VITGDALAGGDEDHLRARFGHAAHEKRELAVVADRDADAAESGVEHARRSAGRDAPVAFERRHDALLLHADAAGRRDELGGVHVAAFASARRPAADEDVHVMLGGELHVEGHALPLQIGHGLEGCLEAARYGWSGRRRLLD
jgi:hypothetical protein